MSLDSLEQLYIIIDTTIEIEETLVDNIFLKEPVTENKQFWLDLTKDNALLHQQAEIEFNF